MTDQFESGEVREQRIQDYVSSGLGLAKWRQKNGVRYGQMSYRLYDKKKTDNPLIPATVSTLDPEASVVVTVVNAFIKVDRNTDLSILGSIVDALS